LDSVGIKIPIKHPITGSQTGPMIIPAIAMPLPVNWPELFWILTRLILPRIIAGIAVMRQVNGARIASTSDAIAKLLVFAFGGWVCAGVFVNAELQELHT
jgi:tryptophan-rich sensory protein